MSKYIFTLILIVFSVRGVFAQKIERKIVYFDFNKTSVIDAYQATLDSISRKMLSSPNDTLYLIGHTDNIGSENYNRQLSQARVEAVTRYLVSKGINAERINVKYYGKDYPVASNEDEVGRQLNRRVDILIKSPRFVCKYELANYTKQ
jgi:outer membrane protein OmpA-like peptidoglycan-associated protein